MNTSKTVLLLALVVGVALSSPCTDHCGGACNVTMAECQAAIFLGPICDINLDVCNQGCAALCGCVDSCTTQCTPDFTKCMLRASSLLDKEKCYDEYSVCVVDCEEMCAAKTVGDSVSKAVSSIFQWIAPLIPGFSH